MKKEMRNIVGMLILLLAPLAPPFLPPSQAFSPLPIRAMALPYCKRTLRGATPFHPFQRAFPTRAHRDSNEVRGPPNPISPVTGSSAVRSQRPSPTDCKTLQMLSFYDFRPIQDIESLRDAAFGILSWKIPGLRGTLYVAHEGINGQFAVPTDHLQEFQELILHDNFLLHNSDLINWGDVVSIETPTFEKFIVRTRNAILRDGLTEEILDHLDWTQAGEELSPSQWHEELQTPNNKQNENIPPLILDCRNDYETQQGSFTNAVPLNTKTFSDSWQTLQNLANITPNKDQPVYIFCTGGIRCVKIGAYMTQSLGFQNVKRLQHGIIGYQKWQQQQHAKEKQIVPSLWEGENFLFDQRRFSNGDDVRKSDNG